MFTQNNSQRKPSFLGQNQPSLKNEAGVGPRTIDHGPLSIVLGPWSIVHRLHSILQCDLCRQLAGRAHDAAAGMRARTSEIISVDRRAETRPLRRRAHEEELMQQQFAVEDVAARDARDAFDIEGRDDLFADDGAADVRRVTLDGRDDRFTKGFALGIVPAAFDIVRRVLHKA